MRRLWFGLLLVVSAWPTSVGPIRAAGATRVLRRSSAPLPAYRDGEVIVAFGKASEQGTIERAIRDAGGIAARRAAIGGQYLVKLEPGVSVADAVAQFRSMREVEYAEPNGIARAMFTPNDPGFPFQWSLSLLNAERMWDIQKGDPSVVVAIVDTGIAYEDFGPFRKAPDWGDATFVTGFNVITGSSHANDDNSHGTFVASVIAEGTDNGLGVAGMAFHCALMPIKVLGADGTGSFFDIAQGVDFATGHGVRVINMSLGGTFASVTLQQSIDRAVGAGIVVVAASGNENGSIDYPAAFSNVIAVGATDFRRQRAPYSNFGPQLSLVAPGGDLSRDDNNDGEPDGILQQTFDEQSAEQGIYGDFAYFFGDGTSFAAPHVSALAALLYQQGIHDPVAIRSAMESTADDLGTPGRDDQYGHGQINPVKALTGLGLNQ